MGRSDGPRKALILPPLQQHFEELHIGWNLSVTLGGIQARHRRLAAHGQVWPAPDLYLAYTVLFV